MNDNVGVTRTLFVGNDIYFNCDYDSFDIYPRHIYFENPVSLTESLESKENLLNATLPLLKNNNQITLNQNILNSMKMRS